MSSKAWFLAMACAASVSACNSKEASKSAPPAPAPAPAVPSGQSAGEPKAPPAPATPRSNELSEALVASEATAVLERWVAAQNAGDFAAYAAMYDARNFRGIKRTHRSKPKEFDGPRWLEDRGRMFDGLTVSAEHVEVDSWLRYTSRLKRGVVSLRFVQRWRRGDYADHGVKVLHLWRDSSGSMRIVYEDLLNSEPGWAPMAGEVSKLELPAPKSEREALALWTQLAPTGTDYLDKLAAIPDDPAVVRPMATALLVQGNFACKDVVDVGQCGEQILEFEPLDPRATLSHPCLRRRLAVWALEHLDAQAARPVGDALTALVTLPLPEEALVQAAFAHVAEADDDLRLQLMAAALESERHELAEAQAALLKGPRALHEAATKLSLDAAVKRLDRATERATLLAAVGNANLELPTRMEVLASFAGDARDDVRAMLVRTSDDEDCGLAMKAIELLESLGDITRLPKRPAGTDVQAHVRALCLIAYDSNAKRQEARFREFLAERVRISEEVDHDWGDLEDAGVANDDPSAENGKIVSDRGRIEQTWQTLPAEQVSLPDGLRTGVVCTGDEVQCPLTLRFVPLDDGLRIQEIATFVWNGCPC